MPPSTSTGLQWSRPRASNSFVSISQMVHTHWHSREEGASSPSWGWRDLVWALRSSRSSNAAPSRATWLAAWTPGMATALFTTTSLYREWCGRLSASLDIQEIHIRRCLRKARTIPKDISQTSHALFSPLLSGKRYQSIRSQTNRLRHRFYLQAIRLLNS